MFVPDLYRPEDPSWAGELVRSFPLATLVTPGPDRPFVTHLPTLLGADLTRAAGPPQPTTPDGLVGATIYGHLNRANPHWSALADGLPAVLVFQGPHGYVTPTVYRTTPAAPTWNYTSVHLNGTLRPIDDPARTMRIVRATVRAFEERLGSGWDMGRSLGYFGQLLPGVGAFEVRIESVDGMFKLSQEKSPEVRRQVTEAFARSERGLHRELATLMERLDDAAVAESGDADDAA